MVIGRIRFLASTIAPKPEEIEYWIDLSEDRYGCVIKYYNGVEWERIDQRTYDEIISFKHKLDELLIEIQECENDLLQHKEDFEEYKNETDSSLNTINEQIESINASLETLLGESASEFIDKYNEILNFLTGYEDTDTLQSILSDLKNEISQNITEIESNLTLHINNKNNPHNVTKQQVGLSNVTNDAQVKRSEMGTANGIATLNEQGLIPSNQLPSYVDDVIDCYATYSKEEDGTLTNIKLYSDTEHQNAITGESGKIYVDITGSDSAYQFRWTGTQFTVVGAPTVIGEVTGTAFDGARGKALENKTDSHIGNTLNPHNVTKAQIGLENVDNTSDINKPISNAVQIALDNKQNTLVSGTNIKTINGQSILGEGDFTISGSSNVGEVDPNSSGTGEIFNDYDNNYATGIYSHAENYNTSALGNKSHAEGDRTVASGAKSHAEGYLTESRGECSHAEGRVDLRVEAPFFSNTRILKIVDLSSSDIQDIRYIQDSSETQFILRLGELFKCNGVIYKITHLDYLSHRFQTSPNIADNIEISTSHTTPTEITIEPVTKFGAAIGNSSHHEGTNNCAYGANSHVGGNGCQAIGNNSFVHGKNLIAGDGQTVFGKYNLYNEDDLFQIGYGSDRYKGRMNALSVNKDGVTTASRIKTYSITVSDELISGNNITIGNSTTNQITSESKGLIITGRGYNKINNNGQSGDTTYLVIGESNKVSGRGFIIVGEHNDASRTLSNNSICVGVHNTICDSQSITVGYNCTAYGNATVAFGGGGIILYIGSKDATSLLQLYESTYNQQNDSIHVAFAKQSMVTGKNNLALGLQSMSNGQGNVAKNDQEFVVGSFNDYSSDINNLFVVGNGTSHTSRSNAFTVASSGNSSFGGRIYCNGIDAEGTCKMGTLTDVHDGDVPWYGVKLQAGEENGGNVWLSGYYGLHLKTNSGQLDFSVSGQMTLNSSFTASGGFYESSDIRLKENVCDITTDKQIDLVQFNWKNTGKKSYGVIAQQIEQNYPELVETNEVTGYKTVKYDSVLILKCAQLENRIKQLEKQLEDLKNG